MIICAATINGVLFRIFCQAEINGKATPSPFNFQTIDDFYTKDDAQKLKDALKENYPNREFVTVVEALESPVSIIREYAEFLFEKDYSLYTAKQWGMAPSEIDPSVLKRVPLRLSYKDGYFDDEYQVMPVTTYEQFFKNILNHPNIKVKLWNRCIGSYFQRRKNAILFLLMEMTVLM